MKTIEIGTELPTCTLTVEPGRMSVFSLLTDDSNPIHWDRQAVKSLGLGDKLINQGGLNVAYVINAVADWAGGAENIQTVRVRFMSNVFEGDEVRTGGTVTAIENNIATVDAYLLGPDDKKVIGGTIRVKTS